MGNQASNKQDAPDSESVNTASTQHDPISSSISTHAMIPFRKNLYKFRHFLARPHWVFALHPQTEREIGDSQCVWRCQDSGQRCRAWMWTRRYITETPVAWIGLGWGVLMSKFVDPEIDICEVTLTNNRGDPGRTIGLRIRAWSAFLPGSCCDSEEIVGKRNGADSDSSPWLSEKMPAARPGVRYGMANLLGPRVVEDAGKPMTAIIMECVNGLGNNSRLLVFMFRGIVRAVADEDEKVKLEMPASLEGKMKGARLRDVVKKRIVVAGQDELVVDGERCL
ncbi:hypothetical protein EX30DRAFT_350978 [Ascodesmis nigricans]|uniref:Uncharacterized protein n=1 Tax=Ascodesmis nigricans TaxID=341454 RepID=A0A4S2MSD1_9PEZI|nr:hypothetical protein EX30DRAFT_350978 [Ascodesmis nigricans]